MADEPLQMAATSEEGAVEAPPELDEPALPGSDQLLAWSSMDLPGMDSAGGNE